MTTEPKKLPYTRPPEADESLRGYLLSLAIKNGYRSLSRLFELAGYQKSRPTSFGTFELKPISEFVAQPEEALKKLVYDSVTSSKRNFLGHQLPMFLLSFRHLKFCPLCIQEAPPKGPKFKAIWDLQLNTVCQEHGVQLVTECEDCQTPLSWYRAPWYQCKCNYDVRNAPLKKACEEELHISHLLHWRFNTSKSPQSKYLPTEITKLSLGDLHWIIGLIGCWVTGITQRRSQTLLSSLRHKQRQDMVIAAHNVLRDWPKNFGPFLDKCRGENPQPSATTLMHREFGVLYDDLMYKIKDKNCNFIRDQLKLYGEKIIIKEKLVLSEGLKLHSASKEIGVGKSALKKMVLNGSIELSRESRGYKRKKIVVTSEDKDYRVKLADRISLIAASKILGLGVKTTISLMNDGVFEKDKRNIIDGRCNTMYSKIEIEKKLRNLNAVAVYQKDIDTHGSQIISESMRIFCINKFTRVDLIELLINRTIKLYKDKKESNFSGFYVNKGDLKKHILSLINQDPKYIDLDTATDEFAVKEKTLRILIKEKKLTSKIESHGSKKYIFVEKKSLRKSIKM